MDVLVTVGVLAGWIYGVLSLFVIQASAGQGANYLDAAIGILAFVLLGRYIEELIRRRSAASIRRLLELQPTMARVIKDDKETDISIDQVQVGDVILVKPGEKFRYTAPSRRATRQLMKNSLRAKAFLLRKLSEAKLSAPQLTKQAS
jgi:Cu+-exporting ATPase